MFKLSRLLIAYAIAVPLALILGYLVVVPSKFTFSVIGVLLLFLSLPLFLKWHHVWLIVFWNSAFNAFFLPGQPDFWILFAILSFVISILNHIMFQRKFLSAPEITRPLFFLSAVVLITAWCRGGIGLHVLGGAAYGGRKYFLIAGAIMGFFALTAEAIPIRKGRKLAGLFFASGITFVLSNLVYVLGPGAFFLYYVVPSGFALGQIAIENGTTNIERISGLAPTCTAALCFLLSRYGIRGLLDWGRPWRLLFLLITVGACFFAGFRSSIMMLFLIFVLQFYFEGLMHTHLLPIIVGLAIFGFAPILFFADTMPYSVQRAISFLPVNIDSEVLEDAKESSQWRFQMWAMMWKELPKYLIIGKGYSFDPGEMYGSIEDSWYGQGAGGFESSMIAGDYHNGPLSIIVPFGVFGVIGFGWLLIGGYRILSWNYRFGDARLRRVNTVLLAYYLANCFSFFFIFGDFNSQLFIYLGAVGFSVSLNGGVKRKAALKPRPIAVPQTLAMEPG